MRENRIKELQEIASRISAMDPDEIHMESAAWMEDRGCRSMLEIYLVRNEVLKRLVYERGETHAREEMGSEPGTAPRSP